MNEDLISDTFVDNVDRVIVKRNVVLSKIALSLCILFMIVRLIDWYIIVKDLDFSRIKGASLSFSYKVAPIIDFIILCLNIYGYLLILKAYKLINASLDKSDPRLLTQAFRYFYTVNTIVILSFTITIASTVVRFVL